MPPSLVSDRARYADLRAVGEAIAVAPCDVAASGVAYRDVGRQSGRYVDHDVVVAEVIGEAVRHDRAVEKEVVGFDALSQACHRSKNRSCPSTSTEAGGVLFAVSTNDVDPRLVPVPGAGDRNSEALAGCLGV